MTAAQKRFLQLITAIQNAYRQSVYNAIRAQINFFANNYAKGITDFNLPKKQLVKALRALHEDAGVRYGVETQKQIKRELRKGASEDNTNKLTWSMNEYFRQHVLEKATTQITETTKKQILQVLQQSNDEGWGVDKTVRALKDTDITKQRAELIVRTETMRAANIGAMIGAADMGIAVQKQWVSAQDDRTRRIPRNQYDHLHMNGIVKDYDQPFIVPSTKTIDAMQYPGDSSGSAGNVCNCRCCVVFIPIKDAIGKPVPMDEPVYRDTGIYPGQGAAVLSPNIFSRIISAANDIIINNSVINGLRSLINNFFGD